MGDNLRTQAGPWCGSLTDTSVVIRASVLRSVTRARAIVAENEALTTNVTTHDAVSLWAGLRLLKRRDRIPGHGWLLRDHLAA